jgi:hypothetical protein
VNDAAKKARAALQRKWVEANKEKWLAYRREWRANNKDKVKEHQERYYTKKAHELGLV